MLESDIQLCAALDKRVSFELTRQRSIPEKLIHYQSYLQSKAPWDAIVPFVGELVEGIVYKGMDPRILRDFQRLLALIKAVTILRHPHRKQDDNDRWIATIEDYAVVREVLNESYVTTVNSGITEDVRQIVNAVGAFKANGVLIVTYDAIATHLGWYTNKVYRKAKIALAHGWLVNQQTNFKALSCKGLPGVVRDQYDPLRARPPAKVAKNSGAVVRACTGFLPRSRTTSTHRFRP